MNIFNREKFPCPYCHKDVIVKKDKGALLFFHKVPGCATSRPKDDAERKLHNSDLLSAYVSHCRPRPKFGPIEGLEKEHDAFWGRR